MIGPTFGPVSSRSPVVREHPLNQGRLSWWLPVPGRMGGGTLQDIQGSYPARIYGNPPWVAGFDGLGGALALTGNPTTSQYARTDSAPSLSAFTISCRVVLSDLRYNAGDTAIRNTLMVNWVASSLPGYFRLTTVGYGEGAAGQVRLMVNATGGGYYAINSAASLSVGVPAHLVATAANGVTRIYIDGKQSGSAGSYAGTLSSTAPMVVIGTQILGDSITPYTKTLLCGTIGDCSLWTRALSANEVAQLYDQARRGHPDLLRRVQGPIFPSVPPGFRPSWMGTGVVLGSGIY